MPTAHFIILSVLLEKASLSSESNKFHFSPYLCLTFSSQRSELSLILINVVTDFSRISFLHYSAVFTADIFSNFFYHTLKSFFLRILSHFNTIYKPLFSIALSSLFLVFTCTCLNFIYFYFQALCFY